MYVAIWIVHLLTVFGKLGSDVGADVGWRLGLLSSCAIRETRLDSGS